MNIIAQKKEEIKFSICLIAFKQYNNEVLYKTKQKMNNVRTITT
jgi:hypothetical protein